MDEQLEIAWGPQSRIRCGRGPLATERLLLEDVDTILGELGIAVLERPVWLVVPSRSLRLHVLARLLDHRGRALAGVDCRTHHSLAAGIVERAGVAGPFESDFFSLLARRFAAHEPALARALGHLSDGYGPVLATVRDLLDAGLDPAHEEALAEILGQEGGRVASRTELARAHAVVRVAVRTIEAMSELGLERSSSLLIRATDLVRRAPPAAACVLVYGYSDATGVTTDFLEALLAACGGSLYLDHPPDPARPDTPDVGIAFSRRFSERLAPSLPKGAEVGGAVKPTIDMFKALGSEAEVREAARRIRGLLDGGLEPERIGIVARTLEPYRDAIRTHLGRLGIPFSGIGTEGPDLPQRRRVAALLTLLRLGERTPVDRWLAARAPASLAASADDLRLGFYCAGAGRLEEAAAIVVAEVARRGGIALPVATGFEARDRPTAAGPGERRERIRRRHLPAPGFGEEVERAKSLLRHLDAGGGRRSAAAHLRRLQILLIAELGWKSDDPATAELLATAERALTGLAEEFRLDDEEALELLHRAWAGVGTTPLGGAGGGVQVLDVVEARWRTFEQLFILGLNRGRFPRPVRQDPVLTDELRHVFARSGFGLLPDLASKRERVVEERFLFAQLAAASPAVTLSWQEVDDEHAFQTPSPLVERLRWSRSPAERPSWREPPTFPALFSTVPMADEGSTLRSAYESAVLAGIYGDRQRRRFRDLLAVALDESRIWRAPIMSSDDIAAARVRALAEIDPPRGTDAGERTHRRLGPHFGFVGPATRPEDPRADPEIFVTVLERMVRCPWQTFLKRVLRLEPLPDPLELLPAIDQRLLGNLVHGVLEQIVASTVAEPPPDLAAARRAEGVAVPWPDDEVLATLTERAADAVVKKEGIALPGFSAVLARLASPFLDLARAHDWPLGHSRDPVLAAEYKADLGWDGGRVRIAFRADRIDRRGDDLMLTDYKTGRWAFGRQHSSLSEAAVRRSVVAGETLQGVAYALAGDGPRDTGRYLHLHPAFADKRAEAVITAGDAELTAAFGQAVDAALEVWRQGTFFPRLVKPDENREPDACRICDVAEACVRGDSGARGRLRSWAEERRASCAAAEAAVIDLWFLPADGDRGR